MIVGKESRNPWWNGGKVEKWDGEKCGTLLEMVQWCVMEMISHGTFTSILCCHGRSSFPPSLSSAPCRKWLFHAWDTENRSLFHHICWIRSMTISWINLNRFVFFVLISIPDIIHCTWRIKDFPDSRKGIRVMAKLLWLHNYPLQTLIPFPTHFLSPLVIINPCVRLIWLRLSISTFPISISGLFYKSNDKQHSRRFLIS